MLQLLLEEIVHHQISLKTTKLVLVLATSTPVIKTREEAVEIVQIVEAVKTVWKGKNSKKNKGKYLENLAQVPCILYPITFWKKSIPMSMLFDLDSEVNAIYPTFV